MSASAAISIRQRAQSQVSLRRRMLRSTSEDKQGELKKSATVTSFRPKLQRLIQEGKIEQILHSDAHSKAQLFYANHANEMERQLASTKKALSTMVMKSKSKQYSINKIKNDISRVQRETDVLKKQGFLISKKFAGTNEELLNRKQEIEQIAWTEKSYINVKERLAKDEIFLRARYEQFKLNFQRECEDSKILDEKLLEIKQLNKQLERVTQQARNISRHQTTEKNQFIQLLNQQMSERQLLSELKADKQRREQEINGIATSLIERQELERILQILNTHKVLAQIIKVKSNNLIKKYERVHKAYMHIKSNANIVEPDKILRRMEEHDAQYDSALKRASILENELKALEEKVEKSAAQKIEILSRDGVNHQLSKGYYQGMEKDHYQLLLSEKDKLTDRAVADQILRKNIINWASRLFEHYGIKQSQNSSFQECLTDLVSKIKQKF